MTEEQQRTETPASSSLEVPQWQLDLDRVGFTSKIFMARKWYGGDWWFVVVSAFLLLFIIIVGLFPQWFAPYDPRAEVGPSLLAPGELPAAYLLVVTTDSDVTTVEEISGKGNNIGFIIGSPASQALREKIDALNAEGVQEVLYEAYTAGEKDYSALVSKLKAERVDVIYLGGYFTEAGLIVRQARDQGLDAVARRPTS